eukprot:gene2723-biopygen2661
MSENDEGSEATVTTAPGELRLIMRDRVEGSTQGRNTRTFHHALMEAFELIESLHKHEVTGPVSRASLPGIFLSGLTPDLHARVHKELLGKVDFHQATGPAGWEAELLRIYVEQATLEERRDPSRLKAARDQSPCPVAALVECLDEHVKQCYALPTTPAKVEGKQLPGSYYTGPGASEGSTPPLVEADRSANRPLEERPERGRHSQPYRWNTHFREDHRMRHGPGPAQKATEKLRRAVRWLKRTHPVTVVAPSEAEPEVAPTQASTPTEVQIKFPLFGRGSQGHPCVKGVYQRALQPFTRHAGWKERKKYDDEKDNKKPGVEMEARASASVRPRSVTDGCDAATTSVVGCKEEEAVGERRVDESDKEVTRFTRLLGTETGRTPQPQLQPFPDPDPFPYGDVPEQGRGPPSRSEPDPTRMEQARLKGLEAEDRLLNTLRKLRERITTYTCPLDKTTGEKPSGHLLQPLKLLMRELQDYFKEPQVRRALATKKMSENDEGSEATVTIGVTTTPGEPTTVAAPGVTGAPTVASEGRAERTRRLSECTEQLIQRSRAIVGSAATDQSPSSTTATVSPTAVDSSLSEESVSPERGCRYRNNSDGSDGRSRGRRRLKKKKKKKSKKSKKQRKASTEEKGKAVATEESHTLTPEMPVKTLFKDKALRDHAFECLPEERQMAIAKALASGGGGSTLGTGGLGGHDGDAEEPGAPAHLNPQGRKEKRRVLRHQ